MSKKFSWGEYLNKHFGKKKSYEELKYITTQIKIPMPAVKQVKEIMREKQEDLQPYIDAATLLNLRFVVESKDIGSEEHPLIFYSFRIVGSML